MVDSIYNYIDSTGAIVPDTSTILSTVQTEYQDVFGADIILTPDTPQGVLITAEALSRSGVVNNNANVANMLNPNIAGGNFLDSIMALSGIQRAAQSQTLVTNVTMAGQPGTIIPAGSQASTSEGDVFQSLSLIILDAGGNGMVNFASIEYGAIPCAANDLTNVISGVLGWETVINNPSSTPSSATTLGQVTQSDQQARALRQNTLGFQGVALPVAITSALYATEGVTSLAFLENVNPAPMGLLTTITGGATLSGQTWGMTTTSGSGTDDLIVVGTDAIDFAKSLQTLPSVNPWPTAAFSTTANITLSGLGTQGGGDWAAPLTAGQIVLVKNQTSSVNNGLYLAESGAWTRQSYMAAAADILGSNSGISMIANSIYVCVNGGSDTDVAAALLENKSSGCGWNGSTSVAVIEPASGQSYTVKFDRPTQVPVLVKVTTPNGNSANVVQSVVDYANGIVGTVDQNGVSSVYPGFVVGADVSTFEIGAAVAAENPGINLQLVQTALVSSYSTAVIPIGLNQIAYTQASYVTVVTS